MSTHSEIGNAAKQVLLLSAGSDFDAAHYEWWATDGNPLNESSLRPQQVIWQRVRSFGERFDMARDSSPGYSGRSPRDAFRQLIRSFGEAQLHAERFDVARNYFRLAVQLSREEPDLLAFRRILDLPYARDDAESINHFSELNEKLLRWGINKALADLYLYRHDLGLYYASLDRWDRTRSPGSGIYHLKRATALANTSVVKKPGEEPPFDARIYNRLVEGYVETDRQLEAKRTWFDLAKAYRDRGMEAEADILLAIGPKSRPPAEGQRDPFDDPLAQLQDFTTEPPEPP